MSSSLGSRPPSDDWTGTPPGSERGGDRPKAFLRQRPPTNYTAWRYADNPHLDHRIQESGDRTGLAGPAFAPLPEDIERTARRKLRYLDAAGRLEDLRVPPGNRLEALTGDRDGQHSIRINRQWRICFRWRAGNAFDVEIVDYH